MGGARRLNTLTPLDRGLVRPPRQNALPRQANSRGAGGPAKIPGYQTACPTERGTRSTTPTPGRMPVAGNVLGSVRRVQSSSMGHLGHPGNVTP